MSVIVEVDIGRELTVELIVIGGASSLLVAMMKHTRSHARRAPEMECRVRHDRQ